MILKNKPRYILLGCPALDKSDNCTCQNCRHPEIEPGTELCNNIENCTIKRIYRELTQDPISAKDSVILNILEPMVELG